MRKTKKIEINEDVHQLPPDEGPFEEFKVADYPGCPSEWSKDGIFVSVDGKQPMWFDFRGNIEAACLPSVQRVNPITGEPANLDEGLSKNPEQNYLKMPDQIWLDGYSKEGKVYQFVVVTEGGGVAVNEVVLPTHLQDSHAMGFAFYLPKPREKRDEWTGFTRGGVINSAMTQPMWFSPNHTPQNWENASKRRSSIPKDSLVLGKFAGNTTRFTQNRVNDNYNCTDDTVLGSSLSEGTVNCSADDIPVGSADLTDMCFLNSAIEEIDTSQFDNASMGAGGRIRQDIVSDNNTVEYYQEKPAALLTIYLALPEMFEAIMKKGKKGEVEMKDRFKMSGEIAGVPVPLV